MASKYYNSPPYNPGSESSMFSPPRGRYPNEIPPVVSPEYRGDPTDGYYNLGFNPEPMSPTPRQPSMFGLPNNNNNYDNVDMANPGGPRLRPRHQDNPRLNEGTSTSRKSKRKSLKDNLHELEETSASAVEIVQKVREFVETEDKKQKGFVAWKKHQKQRWDRFKAQSKSAATFWGPWSVTINVIEGRFGIGIASFFIFLRWLFYLDFMLTIIVLSVTTLPYVILNNYLNFENYTHTAPKDWIVNNSFVVEAENCSSRYQTYLQTELKTKGVADHVKDALQGTGFMEYTVLFYGSYHNVTLNIGTDKIYNYNMSLAYLLALGIFFLICFVLIIRTIADGIKENLVNQQSTGIPYSQKVFGSWDYCISDEKMISRKKNCLLQELRADLTMQKEVWAQIGRTLKLKIRLYSLRLFINILVISILCASFALIYYSSNELINLQKRTFNNTFIELVIQFLPSLIISLLNVTVPLLFNFLVKFEEYTSSYEIKLTLLRITLLRLASLAILLFSLYVKLELNESEDQCGYGEDGEIQCWETYVGQQFYKLILLDFALLIVVNLIFHTARRILYNKFHTGKTNSDNADVEDPSVPPEKSNKCAQMFCWVIDKVGPQEFDLPQNVIDIVYHQSLCWIGVFFCPLISLIITINFFLLFFIKKFTVYENCVQSVRPFRASKSNSLFMLAVLISFLLCILPIALVVGFFHPSKGCGPFRIYSKPDFYIFDTVSNLILSWPTLAKDIFFWIVTPPVLVPLIVIICFVIYYYVIVGRGYKRMEDLLREQLSLDGKDKRFLLGEVNKKMKIAFAKDN